MENGQDKKILQVRMRDPNPVSDEEETATKVQAENEENLHQETAALDMRNHLTELGNQNHLTEEKIRKVQRQIEDLQTIVQEAMPSLKASNQIQQTF